MIDVAGWGLRRKKFVWAGTHRTKRDLLSGRVGLCGPLWGCAEPNQRVCEAPRMDALAAPPCPLRGKILKQRGHHPRRELFEQAHRSWHVPVA